MLIFSVHADTGYSHHFLERLPGDEVEGLLDNYVGVYAAMQAYFSGALSGHHVRLELTYGEETDMEGARVVCRTLRRTDLVVVVDVTGTPTERDFVIEECAEPSTQAFVREALEGLSYDLYDYCPDPIAQASETWVYRRKCSRVFFLGLPLTGGDYNAGPTRCRLASVSAVADAIGRLAQAYPGSLLAEAGRGARR